MSATKVIFIKFGGSLITDKEKAYSSKKNIIKRLVTDFQKVYSKKKDTLFLLGNGAGSYGHYAATLYKPSDPFGFAFIHQKVLELNALIVEELLAQKIPAMSFPASVFLHTQNGNLTSSYSESLESALRKGIVPVVYGDGVLDTKKNGVIYSTEKIFDVLIEILQPEYTVSKVIHLTTVDGFLKSDESVITKVTKENYPDLKKHLKSTKGFDVTGGMVHKIEQSLKLAEKGVVSHVVSGLEDGVLERLLLNVEEVGTTIL